MPQSKGTSGGIMESTEALRCQKGPNSNLSFCLRVVLSYKSLGSHICKVGILIDFSDGSEDGTAVWCLELSGLPWSPFTITGSAFRIRACQSWRRPGRASAEYLILQPLGASVYG